MESRIQDCPGFPYMGRQGDALTRDTSKLEFIDDFIYLGLAASLEIKMDNDGRQICNGVRESRLSFLV